MKNKVKKTVYLALSAVASVLIMLSLGIAYEWKAIVLFGELTPEMVLYGVLGIVGLITGLAFGSIAWKKIYIEGVRGKKYIIKD